MDLLLTNASLIDGTGTDADAVGTKSTRAAQPDWVTAESLQKVNVRALPDETRTLGPALFGAVVPSQPWAAQAIIPGAPFADGMIGAEVSAPS